MRTAILALAFVALIASSQAVTFSLAAGAATDANLNVLGAFGLATPLFYSGIKFTNGNTAATITIEPVLQTNFNAALSNAYTSGNIAVGSGAGVGLKVSADTTGSGTLSVTFGSTLSALSLAASQFVLISTPIATVAGSASEAVYVPPTSTSYEGSNTVSWSISFNRYYAIVALNANANVGVSVATAFQAAFNTTSRVAANAYTQFSASSNAKSSTNTNTGSAAVSVGNPFVQFASNADAQLRVDQSFFGAAAGKTYVAPSGTTDNIGIQYSISKIAGAFNGNLTYNSNGRSFNAARATSYSWFKAATGTASASGWTKISSASSLDANGNLVVTAQQSGDFSEWTVAASPASTVAAGILAVIAALAVLF